MYLEILSAFKFILLIKMLVMYIAIFVLYSAKPFRIYSFNYVKNKSDICLHEDRSSNFSPEACD